jgi:hypothetical protein
MSPRNLMSWTASLATVFSPLASPQIPVPAGWEQYRVWMPLVVAILVILLRLWASAVYTQMRAAGSAMAHEQTPITQIARLRKQRQRLIAVSAVLLVALVVASHIGFATACERDRIAQLHSPPSALADEAIQNSLRYRSELSAASTPVEKSIATKAFLESWATNVSKRVPAAMHWSQPIDTNVYAFSQDRRQLLWRVGSTTGAPLFNLKPESIAGCATIHRLKVHWTGKNDETGSIEASTLNGEAYGRFDVAYGQLILPDGSRCSYDNEGKNEPKRQLVCVPIAASASALTQDSPGAVCLTAHDTSISLFHPLVTDFLIEQVRTLAMVDLYPVQPSRIPNKLQSNLVMLPLTAEEPESALEPRPAL